MLVSARRLAQTLQRCYFVLCHSLWYTKWEQTCSSAAVGNKIARRLAEQGCTVAAWNRDASKAQALSEVGITVHDSAQQAIQASDVLLLMLSDADAIQDVLLNANQPVDLKGKVVLQMGTIGDNFCLPALLSVPVLVALICIAFLLLMTLIIAFLSVVISA